MNTYNKWNLILLDIDKDFINKNKITKPSLKTVGQYIFDDETHPHISIYLYSKLTPELQKEFIEVSSALSVSLLTQKFNNKYHKQYIPYLQSFFDNKTIKHGNELDKKYNLNTCLYSCFQHHIYSQKTNKKLLYKIKKVLAKIANNDENVKKFLNNYYSTFKDDLYNHAVDTVFTNSNNTLTNSIRPLHLYLDGSLSYYQFFLPEQISTDIEFQAKLITTVIKKINNTKTLSSSINIFNCLIETILENNNYLFLSESLNYLHDSFSDKRQSITDSKIINIDAIKIQNYISLIKIQTLLNNNNKEPLNFIKTSKKNIEDTPHLNFEIINITSIKIDIAEMYDKFFNPDIAAPFYTINNKISHLRKKATEFDFMYNIENEIIDNKFFNIKFIHRNDFKDISTTHITETVSFILFKLMNNFNTPITNEEINSYVEKKIITPSITKSNISAKKLKF